MKSICVLLVSLCILCPLVVNAKTTVVAPTLESLQQLRQRSIALESCVENLRNDLRVIAEEIGGWAAEVVDRMIRLIQLRRTCDDIHMSDPPTRWELIQREACELRFQAQVAFEMTRLTAEINHMLLSYPPVIRESIERFLICSYPNKPDLDEFHQIAASLHRH